MMKSLVKQLQWRRWFFLRDEIDRVLTLGMLFSIAMVCLRILYSHVWTYAYMPWNLFLAYLPYLLSKWLLEKPQYIRKKPLFLLMFVVWIFFIPNSFYVITDLFHLLDFDTAPLWFDLILLMSFAWNSLIMGILSVRQMEKAIGLRFNRIPEFMFIYPVMVLNALGVYIGRYLRFNSWDVVVNPFGLMSEISGMIFHPLQYREALGMIFFFSILMTLMYLSIKKISKSIW